MPVIIVMLLLILIVVSAIAYVLGLSKGWERGAADEASKYKDKIEIVTKESIAD